MKTIVRWTVGPVSQQGFDCLKLSVKKLQKIIGKKALYVICHNNLTTSEIEKLPKVDCLIDQKEYAGTCPPPNHFNPGWKLYPPRLDLNSQEILLDNDLIVYRLPSAVEKFLDGAEQIIVTEAFRRSYNGELEKEIPKSFNINTGLLCLPPGFDFSKQLKPYTSEWQNWFDEQTIIAHLLSREISRVEVIPTEQVFVCFERFKKGTCGVHFVGLNQGNTQFWDQFKSGISL